MKKLLYLVASDVFSFEKTFPVLTKGIPQKRLKDFVMVISGSDREFETELEGMRVRYVRDSSSDYSPLIDLIKHPYSYDCDFVFLMNDEVQLGKSFFKKVEKFDPSFDSIAVNTLMTNFGWLKKDFLLKKADVIRGMENAPPSLQLKNKAKLFKLSNRKTTFVTKYQIKGKRDIYNDDIERLVEYFDGVDLYRFEELLKRKED